MSVAKPWMLVSPTPDTSHSEDGFPVRQFSATIGFAGEPQPPPAIGVVVVLEVVVVPWVEVVVEEEVVGTVLVVDVVVAPIAVGVVVPAAYVTGWVPAAAARKAQPAPLMVVVVKGPAPPGPVMLLRVPAADCSGTIACSPFAPLAVAIVKLRTFTFQAIVPNEELLRASSQVSICRLDTIGTPRARAELRTASASGVSGRSVCALTVYAP